MPTTMKGLSSKYAPCSEIDFNQIKRNSNEMSKVFSSRNLGLKCQHKSDISEFVSLLFCSPGLLCMTPFMITTYTKMICNYVLQ